MPLLRGRFLFTFIAPSISAGFFLMTLKDLEDFFSNPDPGEVKRREIEGLKRFLANPAPYYPEHVVANAREQLMRLQSES